jgi:hypothetical protein
VPPGAGISADGGSLGAGGLGGSAGRDAVFGGVGAGSNQLRIYGSDTTTTMARTVSTSTARNHPAEKMLRGA